MGTKKNILITAGPTWIALDKARVISNIASGETGLILAGVLKKSGARITLLLGPGNSLYPRVPGVKIINFKYFQELEGFLKKELSKRKYAAVIHAAAVADYKPEKTIRRKISSRLKKWNIRLVPTKKLVGGLKEYSAHLVAVGFKFEPDAGKTGLITKGKKLLRGSCLDIVVANSSRNNTYQAYILDKKNEYGPFLSKNKMAVYLAKVLKDRLG